MIVKEYNTPIKRRSTYFKFAKPQRSLNGMRSITANGTSQDFISTVCTEKKEELDLKTQLQIKQQSKPIKKPTFNKQELQEAVRRLAPGYNEMPRVPHEFGQAFNVTNVDASTKAAKGGSGFKGVTPLDMMDSENMRYRSEARDLKVRDHQSA